jgi:hypothetical protein
MRKTMKYILFICSIIILSINYIFSQNLIWEKVYKSPVGLKLQNVVGISQSKDNNFFILTYYSDTLQGRYIPGIIKTNRYGEVIWSFYQVNEKCIYPKFITEDDEGFNLYCIRVRSFGFDEAGFTPYKYEFDGSNNLVNESFEPETIGSLTDNKGGLLLTKDSLLLNISYRKMNITLKVYDNNAKFIRDIKYDTTTIKYMPYYAFQDTDSNLYLIGSFSYSKENKNFIMKLNKNYEKMWLVADSLVSNYNYISKVKYLPNGNFALLGRIGPSYIADSAKSRIYLKIYNNNGELLVNKQYPSLIYRYVYDFVNMKNCSFVISGDSGIYSYERKLFNLFKTDSLGEKIWEKSWGDFKVRNYIRAVTISDENLIYTAGQSDTMLYLACLNDEPVGVNEENTNLICNTPVFPNPAKELINLELENKSHAKINIILYDNSGRQMKTLFNENIPPGMFNLALPLPDVAPGCYNIIINYGNKCKQSKKIIVY